MKSCLKFSLLILTSLIASHLSGQQPPQPDEGMDILLRTILLIAMGIMCGAAVVGAFMAALLVGLVGLLGSLVLLSVSFVVGLYRKSLAAGFKTFISLFLASIGSIVGVVANIILQQTVAPDLSLALLLSIGFLTGGLGGMLIGFAAFKMIRTGLSYITKKFLG